MSPEIPSQPEHSAPDPEGRTEDRPVDAIVFDVHPALAIRSPLADYPYAYRTDPPVKLRPKDELRLPQIFSFDWQEAPAQYVVPQRFGLGAILGMTTALAILFGCMRWLDAEPAWYLFYGLQSIVISLVQMFHGKSPRKASAVAGAVMGPLFLLGTAWFSWDVPAAAVLCLMLMMVPCGAFLGYLNGTCAAGIFLVMDKLEQYFQGPPVEAQSVPSPPTVSVS